MNVRLSAAGLPDSIRKLIMAEPTVASRIRQGRELEEILASPEWAAEWAASADPLPLSALRRIVFRYGAAAFEEEKAEEDTLRDEAMTGAEWRVALARLRRSGILFAIRKLWGDRLYYLPADMVPVWQRMIAPVHADPLNKHDSREVEAAAASFRLPLSLELLSAWAAVRRTGIPLTSKGSVAKPAAARMASAMRMTSEELAPLGLVYPHQEALPATAAIALDLGLCTGVLHRRDKEIAFSPAGVESWMSQSVPAADAELHRLVLLRYASLDPARHLAASAVASCGTDGWFREADIVRIGAEPSAVNVWLNVLVSFGWAERGAFRGTGVFRLLTDLDGRAVSEPQHEPEPLYVQPDGEVYVTPGVGLADRWKLEEISERATADRVFVYRLTKSACASAFEAGWKEGDVREFLERRSGAALPGPVDEALRDWYRHLGKIRLEEALLLRTDSEETAARLLEDGEVSRWLIDRAGNRDFIVDPAGAKELTVRLEKIGYPAAAGNAGEKKGGTVTPENPDAVSGDSEPGWISAGGAPSLYRPDGSLESAGELFPGLTDVPPVWLRRPGSYHASTRQKLVNQAIGWRAALQIGGEGSGRQFVPISLEADGKSWKVQGRWRGAAASRMDEAGNAGDPVTLPADRFEPLMIVLPALDPLN